MNNYLTNTGMLSPCPSCFCMTYDLMDDNGNRYCGKCNGRKGKE